MDSIDIKLFEPKHFFLLIDKPIGLSSSNVVLQFKKYLFERHKELNAESELTWSKLKIGHSGTLDPAASGLLILAINATRLLPYLTSDKTYEFTMLFGKQTDTADSEGKIIAQDNFDLSNYSKEEIEAILMKFLGKIKQRPHKFSAIKINGNRAYKLARQDVVFEIPEREVEIYSLDILEIEKNSLKIRVQVSNGFYIRVFAEDIAKMFNTIGMITQLRRIEANGFNIEKLGNAEKLSAHNIDLHNNIKLKLEGKYITAHYQMISLNILKEYYPKISLSSQNLEKLKMGSSVNLHGLLDLEKLINGTYVCVDCEENFHGIIKIVGGVIFPLYMVKI